MRIEEQETQETLQEYDDDDDIYNFSRLVDELELISVDSKDYSNF